MLIIKIRVRGRIDPEWSGWFEGLGLRSLAGPETMLQGELADQAALYGVLAKLGRLGLDLLSVQCSPVPSKP